LQAGCLVSSLWSQLSAAQWELILGIGALFVFTRGAMLGLFCQDERAYRPIQLAIKTGFV
jgi:hypothetical protein